MTAPVHGRGPALARWLGRPALVVLAASGVSGTLCGPVPAVFKGITLVMLAVAAFSPATALLTLAALVPFADPLQALIASPVPWPMPLGFAVLTGAALRQVGQPQEPDRRAFDVALAWIALVTASATTQLWRPAPSALDAIHKTTAFWTWFAQYAYVKPPQMYAFTPATVIAVVLASLFALTARTFMADRMRQRQLLHAIVLGGGGAGWLSLLRLVEVSLRRPPVLTSLAHFNGTIRLSPLMPDVNAAAAFFLMLVPLALALIYEPGLRRMTASVALVGMLGALWLAGSRTAYALLPIAAALQWWLTAGRAWRLPRSTLAGAACAVAVLAVVLMFFARPHAHGQATAAVTIRQDMAIATFRMARAHPVFGAGIGMYQATSPAYMPERLFKWYRSQNAHNQFLQVLGELGLTGLWGFLALLAVALMPGVRAIVKGKAPPDLIGVVVGLGAFLLVCLAMHPLLMPEVALVFGLLLGLARAGPSATDAELAPARRDRWTTALLCVALGVWLTIPWRLGYLRVGARPASRPSDALAQAADGPPRPDRLHTRIDLHEAELHLLQ
jgi:O-antigen ligase